MLVHCMLLFILSTLHKPMYGQSSLDVSVHSKKVEHKTPGWLHGIQNHCCKDQMQISDDVNPGKRLS